MPRRSSDHTTAIALLQHFGSSQSRFITFVEEVFSEVPRYHFHVKSGQLTVLDQEGVELADIANAVTEAAQRAQVIVSKDVLQGASAVSRMIIIADDELRTVTELPF
jgi:phage terminase large subunit-like protein